MVIHAHVQEISISRIRQQAARVFRGYMTVAMLPGLALVPLLGSILHDLPRFDGAKLVSPKLWVLTALTPLGIAAARACGDRIMCKRWLGGLIALDTVLLLAAGAAFLALDFAGRTEDVMTTLDTVAGLLVMVLPVYLLVLSPALAAIRLLATRLPPDDVPFPTAITERMKMGPRALPSPLRARVWLLRAIAFLTGLAAAVTFLWLLAQQQMLAALAALVLNLGTGLGIRLVWRRAQRLAAVDANERLKHDPRAPVLYLRSFQDDSAPLGTGADMLFQVRSSAPSAKPEEGGALARAWRRITKGPVTSTGGRLEELLASQVRGVGPFVAIGAPTEPLPELGAARAYFSNDTWQSAIIRWVDLAGLIITVIGPTKWIRWELDTRAPRIIE
jgi:hypothetical protein